MSAFSTRIARSPLAGLRAGLQGWHIACSGCTGSAPHTREPRHPLSDALELGRCSRLETPNARAGRWSDRIRHTSGSGKDPFSDVPLAGASRTGRPQSFPVENLAPLRAGTQTSKDRKASTAAGKRVLCVRLVIFRLVCLARDAPQRSARASLSPRKRDEPRWRVPTCSSLSVPSSFTASTK